MVSLSMTLVDPWTGCQGRDFFNIEYLRKGTTESHSYYETEKGSHRRCIK